MRTWPSSKAVFLARSEVPAANPNRSFMKIKSVVFNLSFSSSSDRDERRAVKLPIRHFLGHVEK